MNSSQTLLSLQVTDQELAARRRDFKKVVKDLEGQSGLPQLRERAEKAKVRELETKLEHAKMESELATLRERLTHLEERLYSGAITNVKELQAVEAEHAAARKQYVIVEQGMGPAQATLEEAKGRSEQLQKELIDLDEDWKSRSVKLGQEKDRLAEECASIGKKRAHASSGVPAADLAFYESLLARKSGVAVVKVERGVCQGCRVRLPLREITKMRGSNLLVACTSCGRILFTE